MIKVCESPGCTRKAKFLMGWSNGNGKHSGLVCATCDRRLGRENLVRLAGMTVTEAMLFERYCHITEEDTDPIDWPDWLSRYNARHDKPDSRLIAQRQLRSVQ